MFKVLENTDEPLLVEICVPGFENFGPNFGDLLRRSHELEYGEGFDSEDCDDYVYEQCKLEVWLPEEGAWSDELAAKVERFVSDWARVKNEVSRALLADYNDLYPDRLEGRQGVFEDGFNAFTLPKSLTQEDLEMNCVVTGLSLGESSESIGVLGECLWEQEHGFGVVLEAGKVIKVGYSDRAFIE